MKISTALLRLLCMLLALCLLQGCGGGTSGPPLPPPPLLPTPAPNGPEFVYVGTAGTPTKILAFPVDLNNGILGTPSQVSTGAPVEGLIADRGGKTLYSAEENTTVLHGYSIQGTTGVLTELTGSPFPILNGGTFSFITDLYVDMQNKFISAQGCEDTRNPDGTLAPSPHCFGPAGAVTSVVDPNGKFVYSACQFKNAAVCSAVLDPVTGALTPVPGSPIPVANFTPHMVVIHHSGFFLYASGVFDDGTFAAPNPHKRVLAFSVDRNTGALALIASTELAAGASEVSLAIHPIGQFLYAADDQHIYGFSVNAANGTLTPVPGSPFPGHPSQAFSGALQVDLIGKFLYLAAIDINAVAAYQIDQTTGAVTPVPVVPPFFPTGIFPASMAVVRTP